MSGYVLSPQADADLVGIYAYTLSTWGPDQLGVYRKHIEDALKAIVANPMLPRSKARDDLLPGCRFYHVEHHSLVYRVGSDLIEVGRILHERMYFEEQLSVEDFQDFGE